MNKHITCPSGLAGEIRGLTGKSFELVADKRLMRDGLFVDKMLKECWVNTTAAGPYELGEDGNPDWQKVLVGDRFYALLQIRCCLYGDNYDFRLQCGECHEPIECHQDLQKLPIKQLLPEDLAAFQNGNRIAGQMPDGRRFWFKLPIGADESKLVRFSSMQRAFLPNVVARIHEIEGLGELGTIRRFLEDADMATVFAIMMEMDEHDCGIDTDIEVECDSPTCGIRQTLNIPFGQGFFVPPRTKRTRATIAPTQ